MKRTKISRNETCPCGSGLKYKRCCIDKSFNWVRDEEGNISREVEMTDELQELLKLQEQRFIEKHGRAPGPDDQLFDGPVEVVEHSIAQGMEATGIHPAIIYAFKKTGLIVSEQNLHLIPEGALMEYQAAAEEWYEMYGEEQAD